MLRTDSLAFICLWATLWFLLHIFKDLMIIHLLIASNDDKTV